MKTRAKLVLGPLLFKWSAEKISKFYKDIADRSPVDVVHLGDVICLKRAPFLSEVLPQAADRLERAGKEVVWSTLGLVADENDLAATQALIGTTDRHIEVNDLSALPLLKGRPYVVGPLVNVYNEDTLRWLGERGARRVCLPPELPRDALAALAGAAPGVETEVQVFGRMPLALSARCYHARAHGLHKDGCRFVCENDPDGMVVDTLDGESFLAVNGIQTLSHAIVEMSGEADDLLEMGITHFRLSPHDVDMTAIAHVWRDLLDGRGVGSQARSVIKAVAPIAPFTNGYFHARPGAPAVADG